MKTEWLVADVTAVGSLDRAEHAILGAIVAGRVFAHIGHFRGRRAPLWRRSPLLISHDFANGHLMTIEWLVTDVPLMTTE